MEATSKPPKARDTYSHVDAEMQVKIAQYACEYGNKSAMEHFTCELGFDVKKSSVSAWKMKYLAVAMAILSYRYVHVYALFALRQEA